MIIDKNVELMVSEPAPELTIEIARELYEKIDNEQTLADIYSVVENKAWWIADNECDFEDGTEKYEEAREITEQWFLFADEIKKDIFKILRGEGIKIPKKGQIIVLEPFMRRNGNGWWIKE